MKYILELEAKLVSLGTPQRQGVDVTSFINRLIVKLRTDKLFHTTLISSTGTLYQIDHSLDEAAYTM